MPSPSSPLGRASVLQNRLPLRSSAQAGYRSCGPMVHRYPTTVMSGSEASAINVGVGKGNDDAPGKKSTECTTRLPSALRPNTSPTNTLPQSAIDTNPSPGSTLSQDG